MNGDYYYEEGTRERHDLPYKKREEHFDVSEVRIIKPADPDKLKALHEHGVEVVKRRKAAGLTEDRRRWGDWK